MSGVTQQPGPPQLSAEGLTRLRRLAGRAGGVAFGAATLALLAGAFSRSTILITTAVILAALAATANAAAWTARTLLLRRSGVWTGLGGAPRHRDQQPRQFRLRVLLHAAASTAWFTAAVCLLAWAVMAHWGM